MRLCKRVVLSCGIAFRWNSKVEYVSSYKSWA